MIALIADSVKRWVRCKVCQNQDRYAKPPRGPRQMRRAEAELPRIRFHDLRHTAASLMLNNGVDVLVASNRLGHAKPSITLDVYGHLIPSMQAGVAEILDSLVKRK